MRLDFSQSQSQLINFLISFLISSLLIWLDSREIIRFSKFFNCLIMLGIVAGWIFNSPSHPPLELFLLPPLIEASILGLLAHQLTV